MLCREIVFFCDMHGHSRKKNVFLYGCETNVGPSKFKERIFPLMLSQMCDVFSWADSHFHVRKEKEVNFSLYLGLVAMAVCSDMRPRCLLS